MEPNILKMLYDNLLKKKKMLVVGEGMIGETKDSKYDLFCSLDLLVKLRDTWIYTTEV